MNSLFDPVPAQARDSDPVTSHEAAASLTESDVGRLYSLILNVLRRCPTGLTVPEIAERVQLPRDTVSPRMRPMQADGLVHATGKRIPPGHTRSCFVWKAGNDEDQSTAETVHDHAGSAAGAIDGAGVGCGRGN